MVIYIELPNKTKVSISNIEEKDLNFLKSIINNKNFNIKNLKKFSTKIENQNPIIENKFGHQIDTKFGKMFRIYKLNCEDLVPNGDIGTGVFPAFLRKTNKGELIEVPYVDIACYPASERKISECKSKLFSKDYGSYSENYITDILFDKARKMCKEMGPGFHMMNIWEWALVSFLYEYKYNNQIENKCLSHNGKENGIKYLFSKDYKTNWTMLDGFRQTTNNEWTMIPNNSYNLEEDKWNIIGKSVVFNKPEIFFTSFSKLCGYDLSDIISLKDNKKYLNEYFNLKRALIIPINDLNHKFLGKCWYDAGERMLRRGGDWTAGANAGLGAFYLNHARSYTSSTLGFRFAFLP